MSARQRTDETTTDPTADSTAMPWASGHADPADQAQGLELELIELTARRHEFEAGTADGGPEDLAAIDAEIERVRDDLARVAESP